MSDEQDKAHRRAVYLVVEPDAVLRMDLTETLQYRDRQAVVIAGHSADQALLQLSAFETIQLALVAAAPCDFAASRLAQLIGQKGGRVVLMGDCAEEVGEANGFKVLHRPYSETEVLALIGN